MLFFEIQEERMAQKKKTRLKDISERTGYSITTISHVINKTRNVDPGTRDVVLKALDDLGYQLPSKRNQLTKSETLGVVIADIRVDFFDELIKELEDIAYEYGYHIVVMDSEENPKKELYCIRKLIDIGVAGIVLAPCNTKADLSFCADFPIVQVDRMLDADYFDFVGIDNMMSSYYLTRKLLMKGRDRIALITFTDNNYCARERRKGYTLAMMEHGTYRSEHTLVISYDADTNHETISRFIRQHTDVDTIICASSNICYEVLCEIKQLGADTHIKNVCTFDNNKWLDHVAFPVDAISQPITDIACIAIDLLKTKIVDRSSPGGQKRIILNSCIEGRSELFIGGSESSLRSYEGEADTKEA